MARRVAYRAPRRKTFWVRDSATLLPDTELVGYDVLNPTVAEESNLTGHTITRIRGHYVWSQTGQSIQNRIFWGFAVRQRSDGTPAGGGGQGNAAPESDPIADANTVDWMWWDLSTVPAGLDVASGIGTQRVVFDIKSQRVINSQKESLIFYTHKNPTGTVQQTHILATSVLLKRP